MTRRDDDALRALEERPRTGLALTPTPLLEAGNLRRHTAPDGPEVLLKMDAWTGFGLGGNKVRKLEHELAPERLEGVDTLITAGSAQSNHARVTAAAAARLGLECILVLSGEPGDPPRGNALLHRLLGADVRVVADRSARDAGMDAVAREVREAGNTPLVVPVGASTPVGALGYVRAAVELAGQLTARDAWDREAVWIVVPSSSCGTVAGLYAGFSILGRDEVRLLAVSADIPESELRETATELARGAGDLLGWNGALSSGTLVPTADFVGEGYGVPTPASHEAVHLLAEWEGVVLDPTYTAKAAAGLLDGLRAGRFDDAGTVVFLHTGGHPALLA